MRVVNVGYKHFHDADFVIDRPEGSGDNLLLLLRTPAVFCIDGKEIEAAANSVIVYKENTPQRYRAKGSSFGNDWFHFSFDSSLDEKFFNELDIPCDCIIPVESIADLSVYVNMICCENYSKNLYCTDSADLLVKLFFIKLSEKLHQPAANVSDDIHNKLSILRSKIFNMPYHDWNIDGMAHELTMSRSSFQHLYKEAFGTTAMNDVIDARIEYSKNLLISTAYTVSSISAMCGYSSQIHFMRQFKQRLSLTPTEYREQNRKRKQEK